MSYDEKYPRVYGALKEFGLSPFYALRCLVEAKRGDRHSLLWIKAARGK